MISEPLGGVMAPLSPGYAHVNCLHPLLQVSCEGSIYLSKKSI